MLGMQNRERIEQLRRGLREATSYKDWKRCADELDKLHGKVEREGGIGGAEG